MKKDELLAYANLNRIDIPSNAKKDEIISMIENGGSYE